MGGGCWKGFGIGGFLRGWRVISEEFNGGERERERGRQRCAQREVIGCEKFRPR